MGLYEKKKAFEQSAFWRGLILALRVLLVICSVATTLLIFVGVIVRYVFSRNFYGSEEIIVIFAFWLYFMGAAYGSFEKSQIKADIIDTYVKNVRIRDTLNIIAEIITIFVCIVFTKWGFDYLLWDIAKMPLSTGLKLPLIIPHSAIFVGFILMTFYHVYYFLININLFIRGMPLNDPDSLADGMAVGRDE